MRLPDWVIGAVLVVFGGWVVWTARGFPEPVGQIYGGGFFPTLVGAGLTIIGALLVLRHVSAATPITTPVTTQAPDGESDARPSRIALARMAALVVGTLVFLFAMGPLGFLLCAFAVTFGFQLILGVRVIVAVPVSLLAVFGVWYVFGSLLRIALPYGVIEALLP